MALDSGDTAWVIAATALVMIMTPALGFFYGGLVRRKNLVSTIAQCFAIFAVVRLVWALWGYTLALGPSFNGFIGSLSNFGLNNVGATPNSGYSATIPELLYFAFQLKFAAITPALIIGAFAERIRFKALLIYIVLWTTFVYVPIAHWNWGLGGFLKSSGSSTSRAAWSSTHPPASPRSQPPSSSGGDRASTAWTADPTTSPT